MAITHVGSGATSTVNQTSITIPAGHASGDLLLLLVINRNSATVPTLAAGWTSILTGSAISNFGGWRLAYKIAASSSETSGTWTSATDLMVGVYRDVDTTTPIQASTSHNCGGSPSSGVVYDSIGGSLPTGWGVVFGFHGSVGFALSTPTGLTLRASAAGSNPGGGTVTEKRMADSATALASAWGGYTNTLGGGVAWQTIGVELKAAAAAYTLTAASTSVAVSGTNAAVKRSRLLPSASAAITVTGTPANLKYGRRLVADSAAITVAGQAADFPTPPRVSLVGTASVMGATVGAMPAHKVDDLIFAFAWRNNSTTPPTLPAGFTVLSSGSVGSTSSATIGWKLATSTSETGGTWTNATALSIFVYRGFKKSQPIGAIAIQSGTSTTLDYRSLTLQNASGKSWVAMFGAHHNNDQTGMATPPSGGVNRSSVNGAGGELVGHDTRGGVTSWAGGTVPVGGSSGDWATYVAEILFGYEALQATSAAITVTPGTATIRIDRKLSAASGSVSVTGTAAAIKAGRKLAGDTVAVTVSPTAAAVKRGSRIAAASAAVTVTPTAANLKVGRKLAADSAAVTVSGTAATFGLSFTFAATSAAITVTPGTATLRVDRKLAATSASIIVTPTAATVLPARKILAGSGSITVTGSAAALRVARKMSVDPAAITITPQSALIYKTLILSGDSATITVAPGTATLKATRRLSAASAVITVTGTPASLLVGRKLSAASAAITVTPTAATLHKSYPLPAGSAAITVTGGAATLRIARKLSAASASIAVVGTAATLGQARRLAAGSAAITVTAGTATLRVARRIAAAPASVEVLGGSALLLYALPYEPFIVRVYRPSGWANAPMKIYTVGGWRYIRADQVRIYTGGDPTNLANWPHLYP